MTTTQLAPLTLKDILIESVDPVSLNLNVNEYNPKNHNQQNKNEVAIKVTLKNIRPQYRKNFIYWIWGKKDTYLRYLNLLVYYLKGKNLKEYIQKKYQLPNMVWETQLSVLGDLWNEYIEKPNNIESLNETTKMENYTKLNDLLNNLQLKIEQFRTARTGILTRTGIQLMAAPPNYPFVLEDNNPLLEKLNILYQNFDNIQTLYLHKKLFLQSIEKIVNSEEFKNIQRFLSNTITGIQPITIINGGRLTYDNGTQRQSIVINPQNIKYYQSLINLIFEIQKIYKYMIQNNKVDAILAFVLNQYDVSINQRNKKSFNYNSSNIETKRREFMNFLETQRVFLSKSYPGNIISSYKAQKYKRIQNIKERIRQINPQNQTLSKEEFRRLKKYQRDRINLATVPIDIQLEHHGRIEPKRINNEEKKKKLMKYWSKGNKPFYMEGIENKNEIFHGL